MPLIGIVVAVAVTATSAREKNSLVNCIARRKILDGIEDNLGEGELLYVLGTGRKRLNGMIHKCVPARRYGSTAAHQGFSPYLRSKLN
jgi:hypothetical protein